MPEYCLQDLIVVRRYILHDIMGLLLSIISIPLFLIFVEQLLSLTLSILGYVDCVKCNNNGRGFAIVGIIISSILLVAAPVAIILALQYGIEWADIDFFTIICVIWYFI